MGPSLVKAGEKQKPPPSVIKGGGIFKGIDLKFVSWKDIF
jgi:hypothetical protein